MFLFALVEKFGAFRDEGNFSFMVLKFRDFFSFVCFFFDVLIFFLEGLMVFYSEQIIFGFVFSYFFL